MKGIAMFCKSCGQEIPDEATLCVNCGVSPTGEVAQAAKSRIAYILLGIFLGYFGIHNFFAGYMKRAIIQLLITLLLGWLVFPAIAVWIWVIIEICTVDTDANGVRMN